MLLQRMYKQKEQLTPGVSMMLILTPSRITARFLARMVIPRSLYVVVFYDDIELRYAEVSNDCMSYLHEK